MSDPERSKTTCIIVLEVFSQAGPSSDYRHHLEVLPNENWADQQDAGSDSDDEEMDGSDQA
jgi:hypothetical protein